MASLESSILSPEISRIFALKDSVCIGEHVSQITHGNFRLHEAQFTLF